MGSRDQAYADLLDARQSTPAARTAGVVAGKEPAELLRDVECAALWGISVRTWWKNVNSGHFPAPIRLPGARCTRWRRADLQSFIDGLGAE